MTDNKSWFEQNYLDGVPIQRGQYLSSDAAYEATQDARADERRKFATEVKGWLVDEKEPEEAKWDAHPSTFRNQLRAELRAKLEEMGGK